MSTAPRGFPYLLGRFLQATGLVLLPLGLYFGTVHGQGVTTELTLLVAGVTAFFAGTMLLRPYRES